MQRFFALIELANTPFIPKTGPANFGDTISPANNVIIKNGTLSLSSHHSIHGNNNDKIYIHDIIFKDFEVADEIFMSGNMNKLTPVTAFDECQYQVGPISKKTRRLYWDWAATTGRL